MQSKGIILNSISDCDKIEFSSSSCLMFDIIMVKTKDDTWEDIRECEEGESQVQAAPLSVIISVTQNNLLNSK